MRSTPRTYWAGVNLIPLVTLPTTCQGKWWCLRHMPWNLSGRDRPQGVVPAHVANLLPEINALYGSSRAIKEIVGAGGALKIPSVFFVAFCSFRGQ